MTDQELREFCFDTNQQLLDEDVTVEDLMRHNANCDHLRMRGQDEGIDKLVHDLYDKTNISQNLTGRHKFAMRLCGRKYPPKLRQAAIERLMLKYDE